MDNTAASTSSSTLSPKSKLKSRSKIRRRYNTVHDLAALRMHPDGSRVAADASSVNAKTLLYARSLRHAGPDAHGNWIARDAAGLGRVKRRRTVREDEGNIAEKDVEEEDDGSHDEEHEDIEKPPDKRLRTARARRRQEFMHKLRNVQDEVLDADAMDTGMLDNAEPSFPLPTADLLKCIHHFASHYYTSEGVLSDKSRDYRKEKKDRKRKRDKEIGDLFADDEQDDDEINDERNEDEVTSRLEAKRRARQSTQAALRKQGSKGQGEEEKERGESDEEYIDEFGFVHGNEEDDTDDESTAPPDMYKAFNGRALVALGMLLQEYVASLVTPAVPPGWEEGMIMDGKARCAGEHHDAAIEKQKTGDSQDVSERDTSEDDDEDEDIDGEVSSAEESDIPDED